MLLGTKVRTDTADRLIQTFAMLFCHDLYQWSFDWPPKETMERRRGIAMTLRANCIREGRDITLDDFNSVYKLDPEDGNWWTSLACTLWTISRLQMYPMIYNGLRKAEYVHPTPAAFIPLIEVLDAIYRTGDLKQAVIAAVDFCPECIANDQYQKEICNNIRAIATTALTDRTSIRFALAEYTCYGYGAAGYHKLRPVTREEIYPPVSQGEQHVILPRFSFRFC